MLFRTAFPPGQAPVEVLDPRAGEWVEGLCACLDGVDHEQPARAQCYARIEPESSALNITKPKELRMLPTNAHMDTSENQDHDTLHAKKMEAIGAVAVGIAHDFNNILCAITGFAELACDDAPEGTPLHHNLQQVLQAAVRARDLVGRILAFSRGNGPERKPIEIEPVVKEAARFLRASIPSTVEIRHSVEPELGLIVADPTQIHQILMNLGANAAHAMQRAGGTLEIRAQRTQLGPEFTKRHPSMACGPYLKLTVSDTGIGIPKDIGDKVFEPRFTTKPKGEGTGLGLSVVHSIVKGHGGVIELHSRAGRGTVIELYFPVVGESAVQLASPASDLLWSDRTRSRLVDDDPTPAAVARDLLKSPGHEVVTRTNSADAC